MLRVPIWIRRYGWIIPATVAGLMLILFVIVWSLALPAPYYPGTCRIYDRSGEFISTLGSERFQPIELSRVPADFRQALLAIEDDRFYRHSGVDLRAILRAMVADIRHGSIVQGGSTITMQVASNLYLPAGRSIWLKIREAFYALKMERVFNKDEILELYVNRIYFGHGTYGLQAAAELYFGKSSENLTLGESALLAGIIASPESFTPYRHPELALERRELTLDRMVSLGFINAATAKNACDEKVNLAGIKDARRRAPYFLDFVAQEISARFAGGEEWLGRGGLHIYTTLDPKMQQSAEEALARGVRLQKWTDGGVTQPQAALVALDPLSGEIRAMVGGLNYRETQFNRISSAHRQPGSSFKPFVYGAALENGVTASSLMSTEKKSYPVGAEVYSPNDASPISRPALTARHALAVSSNVVAVELGYRLGADRIIAFAERLGIESPLQPNLSLPLGTSEITPLELAASYAPFANGGSRIRPFSVVRVEGSDGRVLAEQHPRRENVLDPRVAYIITDMLRDVLRPGGTAGHLGGRPGRPAAGKTGTTQNNRDAWFVGYTPDLVALVYLGTDRGARGLPTGGGSLAAPIWATFMESALKGTAPRDFVKPPGLIERDVCAETGFLATAGCPPQTECYVPGTEPSTFCRVHREVRLLICRRSGQLATQQCRDAEIRTYDPKMRPTAYCKVCTAWENFWDWLLDGKKSGKDRRKERGSPFGRPKSP